MTLFDTENRQGAWTSTGMDGADAAHVPARAAASFARARPVQRRTLAILYADVAGYSRLMCEDEEAAHRLLDRYLDIFSAHVLVHGGTICHYAGDALLASFSVAAQAAACAVAVQRDLGRRNARLRASRRMHFRIGLNQSEVIVARGEIFGIGVNVAARLQTLAPGGGICTSDSVRSALGETGAAAFEDLGMQTLKNIKQPVRAWRLCVGRWNAAPLEARLPAPALAAALSSWMNTAPVTPPRARGTSAPGWNALRNLSLFDDTGPDGSTVAAEFGRRALGVPPDTDGRRAVLALPVSVPALAAGPQAMRPGDGHAERE